MERRGFAIEGTVQGVGFRPFVHGLARRLGLAGHVRNGGSSVLVEVEGASWALDAFLHAVRAEHPPLASIEAVRSSVLPVRGEPGFRILESAADHRNGVTISPDVATCRACLEELRDPLDRRFRHPFLNCTRCGPRFTLVRRLPYDRAHTTMAGFKLCGRCRDEYEDPTNRRFHAQPTCCPDCGPGLYLLDRAGERRSTEDPLEEAIRCVVEGGIVAVKGLGGFHLACDAVRSPAVRRLRERKGREEKPFALMVRDLHQARELCRPDPAEERLLTSQRRPIVLMERRAEAGVAPEVAPGSRELGLMLPYTPLHELFVEGVGAPLVVTSANPGGTPIVYRDEEAAARLAGMSDLILGHDRPIETPCEDSVFRLAAGAPSPIRRSRGWVPEALPLPSAVTHPVLAVGGHLKNTVCVIEGRSAVLSQHVGDLDTVGGLEAVHGAIRHLLDLLSCRPSAVAHDLHPGYGSNRVARIVAREVGPVPLLPVQHHHAHAVSCLAEHGAVGPVIAVVFDGAGYGTDGAVWGGEFLVCDWLDFDRVGHLAYRPLPGGERAVREPWRMALAHLEARDPPRATDRPTFLEGVGEERVRVVRELCRSVTNAPMTSSVGRLFDAAAALLGLCREASFEAQAAMKLEAFAAAGREGRYEAVLEDSGDGRPWTWDPTPLLHAMQVDLEGGRPGPEVARAFHGTVSDAVVRGCERAREDSGIADVALSGGVFQNRLLLEAVVPALRDRGFEVLFHRKVPANDGGLSLGQAAVAAARLEARYEGGGSAPRELHRAGMR